MIGFNKLYMAGRVKRYHTADVPAQTLSEHSWGVAMIVARIYPNGAVPAHLLMAALTHDLAESETGDIPATAKWGNAKLGEVLLGAERSFNVRHGIDFPMLTTKEVGILKWADTFELCAYCAHHAKKGNTYAGKILMVGLAYLKELGFPTTESRQLYDGIFDPSH